MAHDTVRIPDDVVYRPLVNGGGVLLHLGSGQYHQVNETGAQMCAIVSEGPLEVSALVAAMAERYPDAPDIPGDVEEFVAAMRGRALFAS